jgi:hypothetical protein
MRRIGILLLLLSCGHSDQPAVDQPAAVPTQPGAVTGASPLHPGCGAGGPGAIYLSGEVEPSLAIDPANQRHFVGVWQQDRYSNAGAAADLAAFSFDGGQTWTGSAPAFSACTGGFYQRASDPWVSIAPDGTVHFIALAFNETDGQKAMLASRSRDGGRTWSSPAVLQNDGDPDFAMDKETITADPLDARFVYAIWDRIEGALNPSSPADRGPTWFARSTDGGGTWEPARMIFDPGSDAQTIANEVAVLPDGRLMNLFTLITGTSTQSAVSTVSVMVSDDRGSTWSAPIGIAQAEFVGTSDPTTGQPVRSGDVVPAIAVDPATGAAYVTWEDARFTGVDAVAISRSTDRGATWSPPTRVNASPAQAFTPSVTFGGGVLAVTYTDLRDDTGIATRLSAARFIATSTDGGATFTEARLTDPFDLANAPDSGGFFLGDYEGLTTDGSAFYALFAVANTGDTNNRTDVIFRRAPSQ